MAVNSATTAGQIIGPTIAQNDQIWYASILYKADHSPGTSAFSAVCGWEDAAAAHRRRMEWDDATIPSSAFLNSASGIFHENSTTSSPTAAFHNYLIGYDGTNLYAYIDGVLQTSGSASYTLGSAQIYVGLDVYGSFGDVSPEGTFSNFSITEGIVLQVGELQYLAQGGQGGAIRPSGPGGIIEFLPLQTDTLDHGPNAYTQTATAMTFVADPPQLLPPLPALGTPGKIRMMAFQGPDNAPTFQNIGLDAIDDTGTNFRFRPTYTPPGSGGTNIHDPSLGQVGAGLYMTNIIPGGVASSFQLWQFGADQYTLSLAATPSTVSVTGSGANARTFKPHIFVDPGGLVYIIVGLSNDGFATMQFYLMTPSTFPTAWNNPALITGTSLPIRMYDGFLFKDNGTYYICYTNAVANFLEVMSSSSIGTGYTVIKSGNWAGWTGLSPSGGAWEGTCVVQRKDGTWIWYMDGAGFGMYYSVSALSGSFATALGGSWSSPLPIQINGTNNILPNFVAQGMGGLMIQASSNRPRLLTVGMRDALAMGAAGALIKNPAMSRRRLLTGGTNPKGPRP